MTLERRRLRSCALVLAAALATVALPLPRAAAQCAM
jgi:hypothetical protein